MKYINWNKVLKIIVIFILILLCFNLYENEEIDDEYYSSVLSWNSTFNFYSVDVLEKYDGLAYGNCSNCIYLSFDAGYEAGYTDELLNILKEKNIKAAFFITGDYLNTSFDVVKRMIYEGHIVGNHTLNHYDMSLLSEEEIKNELMILHNRVYEQFEYKMKYFRPPMGRFSEKVLNVSSSIGYKSVLWGFAYDDWDENNQMGVDLAKDIINNNVDVGEVVLLHANSKDNLSLLSELIDDYVNAGFIFESLDNYTRG